MSNTGGSYTPPPPTGGVPPGGVPPGGVPPGGAPAGGGDLIYPSAPPKEPVLILVLNLIFVCIGYFILGQWQKGIAALVAALVIGIPTCGFGIGAVAVATAIDGFMQAQQLQQGFAVAQWTFFKDHR
jgi:hypothetical protein